MKFIISIIVGLGCFNSTAQPVGRALEGYLFLNEGQEETFAMRLGQSPEGINVLFINSDISELDSVMLASGYSEYLIEDSNIKILLDSINDGKSISEYDFTWKLKNQGKDGVLIKSKANGSGSSENYLLGEKRLNLSYTYFACSKEDVNIYEDKEACEQEEECLECFGFSFD
ncbi:MAG: hypothetical protein ACI837_002137 [Crocinitomicaceae bacterium]|jgi:hypothetical protein